MRISRRNTSHVRAIYLYKDKSMSLITTPLTVSDGTVDRIFDLQYQLPGAQLGAQYCEPTALPALESKLMSLHGQTKNGRVRHMLQSSELMPLVNPGPTEPIDDGVVINLTVSHHPKHAVADVEKRIKILLNTAAVAGFTLKLVSKNI